MGRSGAVLFGFLVACLMGEVGFAQGGPNVVLGSVPKVGDGGPNVVLGSVPKVGDGGPNVVLGSPQGG